MYCVERGRIDAAGGRGERKQMLFRFRPNVVSTNKLADRDVDHPGMLITHKSQHSHTKHVFIFLT